VGQVVVDDETEKRDAIQYRSENDEWLRNWTPSDLKRLGLERNLEFEVMKPSRVAPARKPKLKLRRDQGIEGLRMPGQG
jgi:hypothetical protein